MARHGERIHKRKDGRWEGRYKTGNDENGRTLYSSVYGKTYSEAKQKLSEVEKGIIDQKGIYKNKNTLSYAIEQWFVTNKQAFKRSTAHKYEYLIKKHILPALGTLMLRDIDVVMLNDFAEKKLTCGSLNGNKPLSKSYVRSIMLIIDSVLKFAAENDWCKPISSVYKPNPEKKELLILTSSEQICLKKNLILNLSTTTIGVLITLQTGLRIGEICALTWNDIDLKNCILYVRTTVSRIKNPHGNGTKLIIDTPKTEASIRSIPFKSSLGELLLQVKSNSNSEYVVSDNQDFISPRTFEYRYHKIMKTLNLPNLNYHALRHTFATRCVEYGVDVKSLSEILGHSNVSITLNTYVHSSMSLKRTQLEKLPALSA